MLKEGRSFVCLVYIMHMHTMHIYAGVAMCVQYGEVRGLRGVGLSIIVYLGSCPESGARLTGLKAQRSSVSL